MSCKKCLTKALLKENAKLRKDRNRFDRRLKEANKENRRLESEITAMQQMVGHYYINQGTLK